MRKQRKKYPKNIWQQKTSVVGYKKQNCQIKNYKKVMYLMCLFTCGLIFSSCQKQQEKEEIVQDSSIITSVLEAEPSSTILPPSPTVADEILSPPPTVADEILPPSPTEADNVTPSLAADILDDISLSLLPTVTPVPENFIEDITGKITKKDFPVIDGSTATIPISEAVYQIATKEDEKEAKLAINHTKTTNSYNRLYNGEADLLIVYEPTDSIIERMKTEPLIIKPIGLDALVFMANAANPVESLTMEELIQIYSGQILNWAEVGGENKAVTAFQRPEGSGSQTLMKKLVMGDIPMSEGDNIYRYYTMEDILEGMLEYTGDDNTLGYSVFYYASNMYYLPDLKFMGVDGVLPSSRTIYNGSYPLVNAFYAVIRPEEPKDSAARKIFDWLTGEDGQKLILNLGYVPVIMPEGSDIDNTLPAAGNADDIVMYDTQNLEEGEHFIFIQKQQVSDVFHSGKMTIYDYKWNKCATFYNVETSISGVYSKRYLDFSQYRTDPDGEIQSIYRIYDLEEGCFLDKKGGLIDAERGYFLRSIVNEKEEYIGQVIDIDGTILLDNIQIWESMMFSSQENGYVTYYIEGDNFTAYHYDRDFHLKCVRYYSNSSFVPEQKDRRPDVFYSYENEGCLLSKDMDVLLSKEKFLEVYGDGVDMECESLDLKHDFMEDNLFQLYRFLYKGKTYEVNRTLEFCWIMGEESGTYHSGTIPEQTVPYYIGYNAEDEELYFFSDGRPIKMQDNTLPDTVIPCEKGCVLTQEKDDVIVVEEHLFDQETAIFQIPKAGGRDYEVYYFGPHNFITTAQVFLTKEGESAPSDTRMETCVYQNEKQTHRFLSVGVSVDYNSKKDLIVEFHKLESADHQEFDTEKESYISRYAVFTQDGLKYITPAAVNFSYHNGFAQFTNGRYVYVYDPDGNIIIEAANRMLAD